MSKKQTDYYYSFTSPASFGSSLSETPSAPPLDNNPVMTSSSTAPPTYEDAVTNENTGMPFSFQQPPAKNSELIGYVRVQSMAPFNPSSSSSSSSSTASPLDSAPTRTDLDNQQNDISTNGNFDNEAQEPLLHGYEDQLEEDHQLINLQHQQVPQLQLENHLPIPLNYSQQYHARYEASKDGILSRDRYLNRNGEALAHFLQQHNVPPHMKIRFHGYHDDIYYKSKYSCDKRGNWKERRKPVVKRVVDFHFDLDCSDVISPQCLGVYVLPDPKTTQIKTVRQFCDEYVQETNSFKQLQMTKVISWDYAKLTQALTTAIRARGYYHNVDISYELKNHTTTIKTDSIFSTMADHWAVRWFVYSTCLFIITWPYIWYSGKKFANMTMKSEWKMKSSEREWYDQHIQQILCQIPPTIPPTSAQTTNSLSVI